MFCFFLASMNFVEYFQTLAIVLFESTLEVWNITYFYDEPQQITNDCQYTSEPAQSLESLWVRTVVFSTG